jgi:hypothetical protein
MELIKKALFTGWETLLSPRKHAPLYFCAVAQVSVVGSHQVAQNLFFAPIVTALGERRVSVFHVNPEKGHSPKILTFKIDTR